MPTPVTSQALLLVFNPSNQLAVRLNAGSYYPAYSGNEASKLLATVFPEHTPPVHYFTLTTGAEEWRVMFTQVSGILPAHSPVVFLSIEQLEHHSAILSPILLQVLGQLDPYLIEIPYLHLGENDYIYKFRVEKDRNRDIYQQDEAARNLYQSKLCEAIKTLARTNERSATQPATLDFGAIQYIIPSHFGFCLGVKNAIERAYESLAENPGHRVFMLSELIHNPFVNEDLQHRGLRYLQSDKGVHYVETSSSAAATGSTPLWETLTSDDVVIIPAFGATDEDKKKLIRKGIRVAQYDATCMLVEKVWKAARALGRDGYTIIIHGKSEHEETKATFSNSRRHAHSLIIRNLDEAQLLGAYITNPTDEGRSSIFKKFAGLFTPGFDPASHLDRIAIVNQTTLLMNETTAIIEYFKSTYTRKFGPSEGPYHVGGGGRKDTLCYATQVNQDALSRALDVPLDAAFIIGGKNSSNTYQLYRLCEQRLKSRAFFIQSEANIISPTLVEHYVFPSSGHNKAGHTITLPLWDETDQNPKRVLITGGASCPDGLVQQVIARLNSFYPQAKLESVDSVLSKLAAKAEPLKS